MLGDDVLVLLQIVIVNQPHRHVLVVLAEGHGALAAQPCRHFLVGANKTVGAHRENDGAQLVEHLVGQFWIGRDFRVEADQRLAYPFLNQDFLCLSRNVGAGDTAPAEALVGTAIGGDRFLYDIGRRYLGRAGEQVVEIGFDSICFIEPSHDFSLTSCQLLIQKCSFHRQSC